MKKLHYIMVGLCYIALSVWFGEVHPFTVVPMYNNFPNWAYSFYMSDKNNNIIPIATYFNYKDDELSHNFSAICSSENISYANKTIVDPELLKVGKLMALQLFKKKIKPLDTDSVRLHRVCYFLCNDSICSTDLILYEGLAQ